tara:strand:- start:458 stop:640 length:183 start_codon:yes stop_codon:yes gene_type:complete
MWWISDSETGESEWHISESEREAWIEHCSELDEMEWCANRRGETIFSESNEISETKFENF